MTLKSSAFPRAFGARGLLSTDEPGLSSAHSYFPAQAPALSPSSLESQAIYASALPHGVALWITEGNTLLNLASKSHSDVASPSSPQCICISHTGLLVAPQTHLALCLHILGLSATLFVFLSTSYSFVKAVPVSTPLGSLF